MLLIILYYALITFTCVWTGFGMRFIINKEMTIKPTSWVVYAIWGFIVCSLFGQFIELIFPLNQFSWILLLLFPLLLSLFHKKFFSRFYQWLKELKHQDTAKLIISGLLVISISVLNAGPVIMDDTESYHIQMIKWIQEVGTAPGIANLHERYGFNSSWFSIASIFIPSHTSYNYFTVINGVLSVWISIYLFNQIWTSVKEKSSRAIQVSFSCFLILIAAFTCWPMIRGNATTANYDFITTCMIIILFTELARTAGSDVEWKQWLPELFIWPVFLFTVRIINYPLLLITLFALVQVANRKNRKMMISSILISIGLVLPFLARNVMLSGYIFYPAYQVDIFNVDWKVDRHVIEELVSYIKYFNRVNAGISPLAETERLSTPEWIPLWYRSLFSYDKPILLLGIAGYLIMLFNVKVIKRFSLAFQVVTGVMILQLVSWFIVAPDPRFVYGPLAAGIFMIPIFINLNYLNQFYRKHLLNVSVVFIVLMSLYIIKRPFTDANYRNAWHPIALPEPNTSILRIDNIDLRIPEKTGSNWNARCYGTRLPCVYKIQNGLRARGKTLREGFKLEK